MFVKRKQAAILKTERIFTNSQRRETVKSRNELHNEYLCYFIIMPMESYVFLL